VARITPLRGTKLSSPVHTAHVSYRGRA
jgi:hypothetical protein